MQNLFKDIDLGNNESATIGIFKEKDQYMAMTRTASQTFKTYKGAKKWLKKRLKK